MVTFLILLSSPWIKVVITQVQTWVESDSVVIGLLSFLKVIECIQALQDDNNELKINFCS